MDLDAYVAAHSGEWRELERLAARSNLTAADADRLVELYQVVATHVSVLRTKAPDPTLVQALSMLVAKARRRTGRAKVASWRSVSTFFTRTFPAGLYRLRYWWLSVMLGTVVAALGAGGWLALHPSLQYELLTPGDIKQLVEVDFEHYYSTYAASHFAAQVWTHNAWLSILCVALGVLGLPTLYLLWSNALNLGLMGAILTINHRATLFWTLILPHGLLELTAVFVAGGAGLRLFWSWVAPGPRSRMAAVAREGRTTIMIAMGLVAVLFVSGILEGS